MSFARIPNIADQLDLHAVQRPTKTAVIAGTTRLDYRTVASMVRQRAALLIASGVQPGGVVGVALKDTPEHLVMLYAVAKAGAAILPVDCRWLASEKERVSRHFGARFVVVEPGQGIDGVDCLVVDEAWSAKVEAVQVPDAFPDGDRGFCMSLSSGTTGRPKGPLLTHGQFMSRFFTHYADLGFGSRETYLNATPLYFGGGRAFSISALYVGGTVVLFSPPHTLEVLAAEIERSRASITFLVPTLLRRLLAAPADVIAPFQRLSTLISSGSPLTADERVQIRESLCANFIEYYSSTEGGGVTVLSAEDQLAFGASVGRPVFGVEIEIVDDSNQVLQAGQVGRIRYRGPTVADGFYNDEDAGKEAFQDGWFYPGDLGEMNDEGYLFLRGRAKDMILRGGVNIYPLEIETILMNHPRVAEVAVIAVPSKEFDEEVGAFIRLAEPLSAEEVVSYCRQHLAPYKVPRHVFFVEAFACNAGGKILKAELVKIAAQTLSTDKRGTP